MLSMLPEYKHDLPHASEGLERAAHRLIATGLSPEEYAGLRGANILVFSLHKYRFHDAEVMAYVQRLGHILTTPELLLHCQEQSRILNSTDVVDSKPLRKASEAPDHSHSWRRRQRPAGDV